MSTLAKNLYPRYVIVSPVKDEERYVEHTLRSVVNQNLKPVQWVVVDDGSKDNTPLIVSRYAVDHPFIRMERKNNSGIRAPGSAVIQAFNFGYKRITENNYDFIIKLDCDLSFGSDYFEKLLLAFQSDEQLGIASGVYFEMVRSGAWKEVAMPFYHAAGACKVIRRKCFEEIGGFVVAAGWDTVDEIRAMTRGWKTMHFPNLRIKHHKREGTGVGLLRTSVMHGRIYYLTGGGWLFLALKVFHRIGAKPYLLNAIALLWGYLQTMLKHNIPLVTETEARCYHDLLNERIWRQAKALFGCSLKSFKEP